ncbi:MAG: helix-turn-helix transcriptional regulator [Spirochaetes bacterium]|nr:helix-turn-helix transcriptional regulator [Spirochaetota bacterium]
MKQRGNQYNASDFLLQVGRIIKAEREKAGLTQEKLAEVNGVDYKYFQRIEYGEVNFTMKTLVKIANSLNLHPRNLLDIEK